MRSRIISGVKPASENPSLYVSAMRHTLPPETGAKLPPYFWIHF